MIPQHNVELRPTLPHRVTAAATSTKRSMTRSYLRSYAWNTLAIAALLVSVYSIAEPMLRHWALAVPSSDFHTHSRIADELYRHGTLQAPHFMYHAILAGVYHVIQLIGHPNSLYTFMAHGENYDLFLGANARFRLALPSMISCLIFTGFLATLIWSAIYREFIAIDWLKGGSGRVLSIALTVAILVAAPAAMLWNRDGKMYLGYIALNVWHSPTMLILKPLAVLNFFYAAAIFKNPVDTTTEDASRAWWHLPSVIFILSGAILTMCSTLSKPNYSLCLLPGVALFVPIAWYRGFKIRWGALLFGLILPSLAVLGWQYWFTYSFHIAGSRPNSLIFAPLLSISLVSPDFILWKFFLSIVFPGIASLLFIRHVFLDHRMALAWLVFACGVAWYYLVSEKQAPGDGNFGWGAQMALFILFLQTLLFILRRMGFGWPQSALRRAWLATSVVVCFVALGIHVTYGVLYNDRVLRVLVENKPHNWF